MKQLAIWILGLIECPILLMMKFIKVLGGNISADSAVGGGKLIKIPRDTLRIKGPDPPQPPSSERAVMFALLEPERLLTGEPARFSRT